VNLQLDKLDQVTDSAVDAADSADTAVRAVSFAITRPVQKISGLAAGVSHGVSSLKARRGFSEAVADAKDAAARREEELAEELAETDGLTRTQEPARTPKAAPTEETARTEEPPA
jgi:hypothetical protein